ncbi:MAG: hydroxymethylglutaryl-CoA lyase [Dehalococcoidia bacterium]|nr:hydroxymethylglutaryl-CoA lyase [Dehalococcoidia bacterium]
MPELPSEVLLVEVGPRDGLQNEKQFVPTAEKVRLINELSRAGFARIEATSFVSPKAVPQLADAGEVMAAIDRVPGVQYAALIPNERGLARALEAKVDLANLVVVASESFNQRNVKMSVRESMDQLRQVVRAAEPAAMPVTVVIGTAYHCPFEGPTPPERVLGLVAECVDMGLEEVTLADTIGAANPYEVAALGEAVRERFPTVRLGLHLHDTRGMGVVNALAGLQSGYTRLESSIGGLGGCPFAPKATGNACTEELVFMLQGYGLAREIDLDALLAIGANLDTVVGHALQSGLLAAGRPVPVSA